MGGQVMWHVGALPPLLCRILELLGLPESLYTNLPKDRGGVTERVAEMETIQSG